MRPRLRTILAFAAGAALTLLLVLIFKEAPPTAPEPLRKPPLLLRQTAPRERGRSPVADRMIQSRESEWIRLGRWTIAQRLSDRMNRIGASLA
jgi:hypothetical protein